MFQNLVLKEQYSFIFSLTLGLLLMVSCSTEQDHNHFSPLPVPENKDFEAFCLEKIEETGDPFWYYRLALVQFEKRQHKSALKNINLAMMDTVTDMEFAKLKSMLLLRLEKYSDIAFLKAIQERDMTEDQASYFAELAIRSKDEPLYLKFLSQIDNESDQYLYLQALHYYHTGEKTKAITYLDKAIAKSPGDEELFKMYLKLLVKDSKPIEVNRLIQTFNDKSSMFYNKFYGMNLLELDSNTKATAYLLKAHQLDSLDAKTNLSLAKMYKTNREYDAALVHAQKVLKEQNEAEAHFIVAFVLANKKFYHSAEQHLLQSKALKGDNENLNQEILKLERKIRYLQARKIARDTVKKDSIQ